MLPAAKSNSNSRTTSIVARSSFSHAQKKIDLPAMSMRNNCELGLLKHAARIPIGAVVWLLRVDAKVECALATWKVALNRA